MILGSPSKTNRVKRSDAYNREKDMPIDFIFTSCVQNVLGLIFSFEKGNNSVN